MYALIFAIEIDKLDMEYSDIAYLRKYLI